MCFWSKFPTFSFSQILMYNVFDALLFCSTKFWFKAKTYSVTRFNLFAVKNLNLKHSKLLQPDIQRLRCNSLLSTKFDWKLKRIRWNVSLSFLKTIYNLKHSKTIQKAYKTRDKISKKHLKVLVQFLTSASKPLHFAHFS